MTGVHDLSTRGASRQLWEIQLMWNGGRRQETHGLFWCNDVDAVNQIAISLWPQLAAGWPCCRDAMGSMGCQENVDGSRTRKGAPYQGFATLGDGQAAVNIFVKQITRSHVPGLGVQLVKRALQSRNLSKVGSRDELSRRLADYILYPSTNEDLHTSWKWKCIQENGVDIYTEMRFDAPHYRTQASQTNEIVKASEERVGNDGIRFLRLADGSGWLPTADPSGRIVLIREDVKLTHVIIQKPCQWNQEDLRSTIQAKRMNPYLAVEAYVEGACGERRELPWPAKHPPWQTDVHDMTFPLILTFVEPGKPPRVQTPDPTAMSLPEAVITPVKRPGGDKELGSRPTPSSGDAPSKEERPQPKRRRLRQKTTVPAML